MDRVFLPVKWGSRSYLIPAERLQDFCDAIIRGDEPRDVPYGKFYVLGLDDRVSGTPQLPERWATYLRNNLVIGTIVEVAKEGRARIDLGSVDGIHVGSTLTVHWHNRRTNRQMRAGSVKEHSCEVQEINPSSQVGPVEAGWKVVAERKP